MRAYEVVRIDVLGLAMAAPRFSPVKQASLNSVMAEGRLPEGFNTPFWRLLRTTLRVSKGYLATTERTPT
jgi:hypothetical protein